jgi:S1-C subfamily serine protease
MRKRIKKIALEHFVFFMAGIGCFLMYKGYKTWNYERGFQNVRAATYTVLTRNAQGTGVVVRSDKNGSLILTNKHVCLGSIQSPKERDGVGNFVLVFAKPLDADPIVGQVIEVAQNTDLCLIHLDVKDLAVVRIAHNAAKPQQKIYTHGTPKGQEDVTERGKITGKHFMGTMMHLSAKLKVRPGASGSGVFNEDNELIGLVALMSSSGRSQMGYANPSKEPDAAGIVPLEHVKLFLAQFGIKE